MARGQGEQNAAGHDGAAALPDWAREIVLLGCHGGAGTTTLRILLKTPWELGAYSVENSDIATFGRPLTLVTRDNAAAAIRAADVVAHVAAAGAEIAALVVVADGSGPEPRAATAALRTAEPNVGSLIRFPHVAGLRQVDIAEVEQVRLPKKAQQALVEIRRACDRAAFTALA
ncbi:hypothetical protein GCM10027570_37530 [Streptomonospora sediminis]